jgi:HlyD family secretion protein
MRTGNRGQGTGDRGQGSGTGSQRSGVRGQQADVGTRPAAHGTHDREDAAYSVLRTKYFVLGDPEAAAASNTRSEIAVLLVLTLAGCGPTIGAGKPAAAGSPVTPVAAPASAPSSAALEVVLAGPPTRKSLTLTTTQPARIEALEQTPIHSKLAAYVGQVLVDYGDQVKKDQPLLLLVAPELDAERAQKIALLDQAKAELAQAEAGHRAAQAAIATARAQQVQAEAGISRAAADVDRWRSEFTRIEQLAASGAVNRQLVDETQQKLRAAEATLKESSAAIDSARATVVQSQAESAKAAADVESAAARIHVAEANVAQVEAMRSYMTIKAPFDGIVTLRQVDPGHFVQPAGSDAAPLLVVARSDKMRVFAAVPEIEASYVDLGDVVTIEVQSLRGAEFNGQVTRTSFALDAGSRALETIIDLDNREGRLRPGLYATVKITLQEQNDALTLPSAAVVRQGKAALCFRLIDGKASKTDIQLGIKVADEFEVASGLSEDDTVILNKAAALKDGQAVEVLKAEAKK